MIIFGKGPERVQCYDPTAAIACNPTRNSHKTHLLSQNHSVELLIDTTWCQLTQNRNNLPFENFSPNSSGVREAAARRPGRASQPLAVSNVPFVTSAKKIRELRAV